MLQQLRCWVMQAFFAMVQHCEGRRLFRRAEEPRVVCFGEKLLDFSLLNQAKGPILDASGPRKPDHRRGPQKDQWLFPLQTGGFPPP